MDGKGLILQLIANKINGFGCIIFSKKIKIYFFNLFFPFLNEYSYLCRPKFKRSINAYYSTVSKKRKRNHQI